MRAVLKNNLRRLAIHTIILLIIFIAAAVAAAIFASTGIKQTWDVAVVSESSAAFSLYQNTVNPDSVKVTLMDTTPLRTDLVSGKYDAILTLHADGSHTVDSIKSEDTTAKLLGALEGQQNTEILFSGRGTGTNVLGFLMTFLLLMGSTCMSMYADDKSYGQIRRVAAAPLKISTYLFAHSLFNFCFLFFPTMIILSLVTFISSVDIGFSFLQLIGLVALLCAFSSVFCLLLFSLLSDKNDSAKMTGNTIIILTSILAGGFFAFDQGNHALSLIIQVLPQKALLTVANGLEQHLSLSAFLPALVYLAALIVAFYVISVIKTKRAYVGKR
ncbi:MAG: ABC transporter permease [Peptococcaceae bacterium]|nr:ABC transporter permease [Peptococcaceae bacterium]